MPVMFGQVGNIPSTSVADGTTAALLMGKSAEGIVAELHGKWYTANVRNRVFMANNLAAGTTIPVQATNLVSTFTLWNPLGSGVNVELIRYSAQILAATTVVADISLYMQAAVGATNTIPGTLTALAVRPAFWGGASVAPLGAAQTSAYSAATLVNTMATNMFRGPTLAGFSAVTSTSNLAAHYDFDGAIILGPGSIVTIAGTAAQASAAAQTFIFAEWPA